LIEDKGHCDVAFGGSEVEGINHQSFCQIANEFIKCVDCSHFTKRENTKNG